MLFNQLSGGKPEEPSFVLVDSVISDLKRWIRDIFHGVSKKHLQSYLNEYAFIYNRRLNPPVEFHTLLGLSFRDRVPTYEISMTEHGPVPPRTLV